MKKHSKALVFFVISKQIPIVYSADRGRAEKTISRYHNTVLVDGNKGLYCSSKIVIGRAVPIHLIKKTFGKIYENLACIYQNKQQKEVVMYVMNMIM